MIGGRGIRSTSRFRKPKTSCPMTSDLLAPLRAFYIISDKSTLLKTSLGTNVRLFRRTPRYWPTPGVVPQDVNVSLFGASAAPIYDSVDKKKGTKFLGSSGRDEKESPSDVEQRESNLWMGYHFKRVLDFQFWNMHTSFWCIAF